MTRAIILITLALSLQMCSDNESFRFASEEAQDRGDLVEDGRASKMPVLTSGYKPGQNIVDQAKLIKTANIKMKVKSVKDQTELIENIVIQHGGYVSTSDLGADVVNTQTRNWGEDSVMTKSKHSSHGKMTLRVPQENFTKCLKDIEV
ncbi:MAG: DUF4349 domain-containing protein, partial [Bacteroidetes bacterium]|nr:DUF4349 domain-containing protein [Bacteroidota bacterium]